MSILESLMRSCINLWFNYAQNFTLTRVKMIFFKYQKHLCFFSINLETKKYQNKFNPF